MHNYFCMCACYVLILLIIQNNKQFCQKPAIQESKDFAVFINLGSYLLTIYNTTHTPTVALLQHEVIAKSTCSSDVMLCHWGKVSDIASSLLFPVTSGHFRSLPVISGYFRLRAHF